MGLPPETEARLPRAIWWAVFQLFGADDGEAFNAIFPCISRAVQKDEWRAISGVAPITTDEKTIGKIVAFVAAARALLIEEPLAERTRLLKLLIEAGTGMRELWIKEIEATRAGEEGVTIVELGDGWVQGRRRRVDGGPEARILKRNRPASKSASA